MISQVIGVSTVHIIYAIFGLIFGLQCEPHSSITRDESLEVNDDFFGLHQPCMITASFRTLLRCSSTNS